jgi:hypothetical protein
MRVESSGYLEEVTSMRFPHLVALVSCFAVGVLVGHLESRPGSLALADDKEPAAVDATSGKALLEAARAAYEGYIKRRQNDVSQPSNPEYLYRWSRRWMEAELALGKDKTTRSSAYTAHLERMRKLEEFQEKRVQAGLASKFELPAVKFYRIEAEEWLAEAKG